MKRCLLFFIVLLTSCANEQEHACPSTDGIDARFLPSFGTILFDAQVLASQTCGPGYCSEGQHVVQLKILDVLADCQDWRGSTDQALKAGATVVMSIPPAAALQVGAFARVACAPYSACADGCVKGPDELPPGPCWNLEFGCSVRCYHLSFERR